MSNTVLTTTLTMTSREIAELTGKRHDNVVADIQKMLKALEKDALTFQVIYFDSMNRQQIQYQLDRELTETLVTGYSIPLRHRVIQRLHELEAQQKTQLPDLTTDIGKLLMIQELTAKQIVLVQENQQQAKQIESLQSLFQEGMTVPQFCKQLNGVNVQQVNAFLLKRNWLFQQGSQWRVAAYARDKYLTEHQNTITPHGKDPFITHKPVLLKAGAKRLHSLYLQDQLPMKKGWDGLYAHDLEVAA